MTGIEVVLERAGAAVLVNQGGNGAAAGGRCLEQDLGTGVEGGVVPVTGSDKK